jgi:imidazoleglycerol-phosphate dehydratase
MTQNARTNRTVTVERVTAETRIKMELSLDGGGKGEIRTPVPFLDHMLVLFARHGFFDLKVEAEGDTEIDDHHTVEDVGIVLGEALRKAAGDKEGIRRYGFSQIPMDEVLASATLDLSGRPFLVYQVPLPEETKIKKFDAGLIEDFFMAVVNHAGMTLHLRVEYGRNPHHILEGIFKSFARALDQATTREERLRGVLSTKGKLE